jgi:hypothetical protein
VTLDRAADTGHFFDIDAGANDHELGCGVVLLCAGSDDLFIH